jgi:hypothetical protein
MNRHIAKKDLIALLCDAAGGSVAARYNDHLRSCDECRRRYDALQSLARPYFRDRIVPGPGLKERILKNAASAKTEKVRPHDFRVRPATRFPGWLTAMAAAVVVAGIAGLLVVFLRPFEPQAGSSLRLTRVSGEVLVDGVRQEAGRSLADDARMVVGEDSAVDCVFEDALKITVPGSAELVVEKVSRMKGVSFLRVRLERGMLFSRTDPGEGKVDYSYVTRHADILPIGTEFILSAGTDKTELLLRRGSVDIKHTTGTVLNGREGYRYVISTLMKEYPLSRDDMRLFDAVEGVFGAKLQSKRSDKEPVVVRKSERISSPEGDVKETAGKVLEGDAAVKTDGNADAGSKDFRDGQIDNRREVRSDRGEMRALRKGERRGGR